jgi:hypothetical protein
VNESSKLKEFVNDNSDDDDAVNDDDAEDSNDAEGKIAMPCVVDGRTYPGFTKKTAVGDSSCSTPKYLYNIEELHGKTAQGLGAVQLSVKGDMPVIFQFADGTPPVRRILHGVKVSNNIKLCLISLTAAMSNGASLGSDNNNNIMLTRNNTVIEFDRRLKTKIFLNKSYT